MKAYIIQSGHFSKAGNFIGFSTLGERIHIYKKQIFEEFPMAEIVHRCLGVYENAQVKFPFYCIAQDRTFTSTDGTVFTRLTAEDISTHKFKLKLFWDGSLWDWNKTEPESDRKIKRLMADVESLRNTISTLEKDKTYLEEQLNYYTFEASDRGRRHDEYREAYERLGEKYDELDIENSLMKQTLCDLDYKYDALKADNIDLEDQLKEMTWNYEYAQSERERLELLCKELETDKFTESQKIQLKIARTSAKLAQEVLDKLIETAI